MTNAVTVTEILDKRNLRVTWPLKSTEVPSASLAEAKAHGRIEVVMKHERLVDYDMTGP